MTTKTFVLNNGSELSIEETVQLLLIRTNALQAHYDRQEQEIYALCDELEALKNV